MYFLNLILWLKYTYCSTCAIRVLLMCTGVIMSVMILISQKFTIRDAPSSKNVVSSDQSSSFLLRTLERLVDRDLGESTPTSSPIYHFQYACQHWELTQVTFHHLKINGGNPPPYGLQIGSRATEDWGVFRYRWSF